MWHFCLQERGEIVVNCVFFVVIRWLQMHGLGHCHRYVAHKNSTPATDHLLRYQLAILHSPQTGFERNVRFAEIC